MIKYSNVRVLCQLPEENDQNKHFPDMTTHVSFPNTIISPRLLMTNSF